MERSVAPPNFGTRRFCPHHGEMVWLAQCPIITTVPLGDEQTATSLLGAGERRAANEKPRRPGAPRKRWTVDEEIRSFVDARTRVVLATPPTPPERQRRRFPFNIGTNSRPLLAAPAELARDRGGALARPARGCPTCLHPLPAAIDHSDPFSIALVGHTGSTKTTTVAALVHLLGEHGPSALGVDHFAGTEESSVQLLDVLHAFRVGREVGRTQAAEFHRPYEFNTRIGRRNEPAVVLVHDVAGEDLMQGQLRPERAPAVLWADAIVFLYDPVESQRKKQSSGAAAVAIDQAVMLNAVLDDLAMRGTVDARGRPITPPPLVVAIAKADLLPTPPDLKNGPLPDQAVQDALRELGDGSVVAAANRWPEVHWRFVAPQPPGSEPQGVLELFRLLISLLDT